MCTRFHWNSQQSFRVLKNRHYWTGALYDLREQWKALEYVIAGYSVQNVDSSRHARLPRSNIWPNKHFRTNSSRINYYDGVEWHVMKNCGRGHSIADDVGGTAWQRDVSVSGVLISADNVLARKWVGRVTSLTPPVREMTTKPDQKGQSARSSSALSSQLLTDQRPTAALGFSQSCTPTWRMTQREIATMWQSGDKGIVRSDNFKNDEINRWRLKFAFAKDVKDIVDWEEK